MNKFIFLLTILFATSNAFAQSLIEPNLPAPIDADVLDAQQWKQVDDSVARGLKWLASEQQEDGSFRAIESGQPAVTGFCLMAFLAKGESPVDGQYSTHLSKAIDFIVSQQKKNGLIAVAADGASPISRKRAQSSIYASNAIVYNHAISGLALAEAYGQCSEAQAEKLNEAIEKAIAATIEMQNWKRRKKREQGGWKYIVDQHPDDADLSSTCWQLMFLRSAKNAGFDVPARNIEQAVAFVERCFLKKTGVFIYNSAYKNL